MEGKGKLFLFVSDDEFCVTFCCWERVGLREGGLLVGMGARGHVHFLLCSFFVFLFLLYLYGQRNYYSYSDVLSVYLKELIWEVY